MDVVLLLNDGRRLGVAFAGKADGTPIIHIHGSDSSRLEVNLLDSLAMEHGVRLIGLDRPGYGLSDAKPGAGLLDWPQDVLEVAGQLGIDQFAVQGISAGGPYALACAYALPHHITGCALISTVPPGNLMRQAGPAWMRLVWSLGENFPWLLRAYLRLAIKDKSASLADQEKMLLRASPFIAEADRMLLKIPQLRTGIAQASMEGRRNGGQGERDSAIALLQPWGFSPGQVELESMFIWHGEADRVMPVAPVRLLAHELPHCTAHIIPGEGHFSLIANHAGEIFDALRG